MKDGSYNFNDKSVLEGEIERFKKVSDLSRALGELQVLEEIGLGDDMMVFDLGCGMGNIDFDIAERYKHSKVTGCDRNEYLINIAKNIKEKKALSNIEFIIGDVEAIPVLNKTADFCYSRFVFEHLRNPQSVVKELHRISKPGGIVAIIDIDDAGLILHPEPDGFGRFIEKAQQKQKMLGGDRFIGRRLYELLRSEFRDVNYKIIPITNTIIGNKKFIDIIIGYKMRLLDEDDDKLLESLHAWINEDNWGIALCVMAYGKR
jgi:ubiquinone/menaquinone biosynthesis C-methylase UbiE